MMDPYEQQQNGVFQQQHFNNNSRGGYQQQPRYNRGGMMSRGGMRGAPVMGGGPTRGRRGGFQMIIHRSSPFILEHFLTADTSTHMSNLHQNCFASEDCLDEFRYGLDNKT